MKSSPLGAANEAFVGSRTESVASTTLEEQPASNWDNIDAMNRLEEKREKANAWP